MPNSAVVVDAIAARITDFMFKAERAKQWRKWVSDLRSTHPAAYPVRVLRRPMKKHWGLTGLKGPDRHRNSSNTHFLITIDSALPNPVAWMILLHEWAHVLAWDDAPEEIDHNDAWGVAYAMLWRDHHGDADYCPE